MKDFSNASRPEIVEYTVDTFNPEDAILREVRERSERAGLPNIQVGSMDGLHLEVLARAAGARKAVEIGTLGGYSGICLLRGLQPGGKLHTFEYEALHADVARESFAKAGFTAQVRQYLGPALSNLPKVESEGPFDLVFIDADKPNYPAYLEWAAANLRVGGLLIGDNTFGFGMIADRKFADAEDEETVRALRTFNQQAASGGRFRATMIPTGEGLTVAVKIR
jgi:caffeoyl-CoA O-methyltransferase